MVCVFPEELERRTGRLAAIAAAKVEIERRATERHASEQAEYEKNVAERDKQERESGKKSRGKNPKLPTAGPTAKDHVTRQSHNQPFEIQQILKTSILTMFMVQEQVRQTPAPFDKGKQVNSAQSSKLSSSPLHELTFHLLALPRFALPVFSIPLPDNLSILKHAASRLEQNDC